MWLSNRLNLISVCYLSPSLPHFGSTIIFHHLIICQIPFPPPPLGHALSKVSTLIANQLGFHHSRRIDFCTSFQSVVHACWSIHNYFALLQQLLKRYCLAMPTCTRNCKTTLYVSTPGALTTYTKPTWNDRNGGIHSFHRPLKHPSSPRESLEKLLLFLIDHIHNLNTR